MLEVALPAFSVGDPHALLKDFTPTSGRSLPRAPLPQAAKTKKEKRNKKRKTGIERRKEGGRKSRIKGGGEGKKEGCRQGRRLRVGVRRRAGRQ
jgi:hypothetical protein